MLVSLLVALAIRSLNSPRKFSLAALTVVGLHLKMRFIRYNKSVDPYDIFRKHQ